MKTLFIFWLTLFFCKLSFGDGIIYIYTQPTSPTNNDSISLIVGMFYKEGCPYSSNITNITDNHITIIEQFNCGIGIIEKQWYWDTTITFGILSAGVYNIDIIMYDGNTFIDSANYTLNVLSTNITSFNFNKNNINILNENKNSIKIKYSLENTPTKLFISDINGKIIETIILYRKDEEIDLSTSKYDKGIYIISINDINGIVLFSDKFIKY